jgi:uncharacterized protein (DUF1499 family)
MSFLKSPKLWAYLVLAASVLCIGTIFYAITGVRAGWESITFGSASALIAKAMAYGRWISLLAAIALIYAFIKKQKLSQAISTLALLLVLVPVSINYATLPEPNDGPRAPPLNDISTDTQNPPLFSAVASIRPEGSNTLTYPANGPELQAQAFPDIKPISSTLSKDEAFNRALDVVDDMGWELVAEDSSTGLIEAVSSTRVFSFEDDVVIRVAASGSGSIVDIRSHSRIGRGDRGVNAARVHSFISAF